MVAGKRFYSRRVFAVHGLLLCAVAGAAYLSIRAQFEALRDQQIEEARTDQQLTARVGALSLQNQIELLVTGLSNLDIDGAASTTPQNPWLATLAVVERKSHQPTFIRQSTTTTSDRALMDADWLAGVTRPTVSVVGGGRVLVATPLRDPTRMALGVVSPEQVAQDLAALTQRPGTLSADGAYPSITTVITEDGRVIAGGVAARPGEWLQTSLDPVVAKKLNELLASGNAGSELVDSGGTSLLAVQPFTVMPGVRWRVVSVRTGLTDAVSQRLRPLFLQLLSLASLMIVAVAVVLVSTTVSLTRGRRRIEKLRTDMLTRDLQKARRIQLNWLPAPQFDGPQVTIAAENRPALHISGDFYNWFELPRGEDDRHHKTVVVIGDVSGHGLPAAFLMATTQLLVRNTMPSVRDPGLCLAEINRQLCTLVYNGQFVTMMILVIDHDNAGLEIASAGHHAPLLKRDGLVEGLPIDPQLVVGVDDSVEYQTQRFRTRAGDSFLLYTDGAIEMTNDSGEQFRVDRLMKAFADATDGPRDVIASISKTLTAFHGPDDAEDDLTLLVAQVVQCEGESMTAVVPAAANA